MLATIEAIYYMAKVRKAFLSLSPTHHQPLPPRGKALFLFPLFSYHHLQDYHNAVNKEVPYDGRFDNLLFFFAHQYKLIQKVYEAKDQRQMKKKPNFLEKK